MFSFNTRIAWILTKYVLPINILFTILFVFYHRTARFLGFEEYPVAKKIEQKQEKKSTHHKAKKIHNYTKHINNK